MTAKKTTTRTRKSTAKKSVASKTSLLDNVVRIPVGKLKQHPMNPNVRVDIDDIMESLDENGQYTPLAVQASTMFVLIGWHTLLGMRRLGWSHADCVVLDVDDQRALKILTSSNRTGKGAILDPKLELEIVRELDDAKGTGISQSEIDQMLKETQTNSNKLIDEFEASLSPDPVVTDDADTDDDDGDAPKKKMKPKEEPPSAFDDAPEEMSGGYTLKEQIPDGPDDVVTFWDLPKLRTDMLVEMKDIPKNLLTWAGSATRDNTDEEQWWWYNWGVDSTSGMVNTSQVIVGFFTEDKYFNDWTFEASKRVTKVLNSGCRMIAMPNLSPWNDDPHTYNLMALYNSLWLARYFQEAGLKVIPNVEWPYGDPEYLEKIVLPAFPQRMPLICMQMHSGTRSWKELGQAMIDETQMVFDVLRPKGLLLYCGKPGLELFKRYIKTGCPIRRLETRQDMLAPKVKRRRKKATL